MCSYFHTEICYFITFRKEGVYLVSMLYLCPLESPRAPDRVLQCSMRMSARANPPTSPQYALPPPGPAKCLDISTTR